MVKVMHFWYVTNALVRINSVAKCSYYYFVSVIYSFRRIASIIFFFLAQLTMSARAFHITMCPSSVRLSVCPSVRLSGCPSVCLSVCLSVRLLDVFQNQSPPTVFSRIFSYL